MKNCFRYPTGCAMYRVLYLVIVGCCLGNPSLKPESLKIGESMAGEQPGYRHPVAATLDASQKNLLTVNSKSGSVSVIHLSSGKVHEHALGGSPRDILPLENNRFLTVDFNRHQLIEFELKANQQIEVLHRSDVEKYPQRIVCSADRSTVYVSSLWSRRITWMRRSALGKGFEQFKSIDLDFAPREMVLLPREKKLVVASNFSGELAVIDCLTQSVEFVHQTTGHNIRGLGLTNDGTKILVSNQMLNELAHTSRNDIHWGLLMSNDLRWIQTSAFLRQEGELYKHSHMHPLGKENDAAGDPGGLDFSSNGTVIVTISGTGEIAIGQEDDFWLKRLKVGRRPVAVKIDDAGHSAYVVNSFDDSISVIDLKDYQVRETIPLGPQRPLTEVESGEQLFFDAALSHDGWMSCHSCHTEGHTNGGLNDNFTDGSFGAPKKVISLLGKKGTEPLAWNGKTANFETQIKNSIVSTMKSQDPPDQSTIRKISKYLNSLLPPPSLASARNESDPIVIQKGQAVFEQLGCAVCHRAPTYTSPETYDVGLRDEFELSKFNPPSLLGVSQQSVFFHDGRAKSLNEVLHKFRHQVPEDTQPEQLRQLMRFLESL